MTTNFGKPLRGFEGIISMAYVGSFKGLNVTNSRIDGLMADFSGLNKLESLVDKVLTRLALSDQVQNQVNQVNRGNLSMGDFDGWFAEIVRKELGKTLGIVRAKAMQKVPASAKSAASGILRRMYKNSYTGAIHILGNRKRLSSKERVVPEPDGGKSGIRRHRTVSARTMQIRKYYGPDRSFILRFLESGTDVRTANSSGPTGRRSQATWGNRGNISPRSFFHSVGADMEQAAQELGHTLVTHAEKFIEKKFTEIK
ncbi:MAG: hypothetical protein IKY91_08395 [Akkermansia sp.]|nr:hypothetical protein [Akkermansia sp.]